LVSLGYPTKKQLFYFGVTMSDIKCLTQASHPQTLRKDNLRCFPVHISYGVLSIDLVGTLFSVNMAVSRAYPQKDSRSSVWLIIDLTMSNKVQFLHSDMPLH
jgi:hypothetical protein